MDLSVFNASLNYLKRSKMEQVRLLGGEPTLHPHVKTFITLALEQEFDILLFTNGLLRKDVLDFLNTIPDDRLTILLNTIHPNENNGRGIKKQQRTMEILGGKLITGVNIYSGIQDLSYLLEYIPRYNLKKEIRLGISHSVLSQNNIYLHPKDYRKIGRMISLFKMEASKLGITLGFDCGFVPCMFPEEYLDVLKDELYKAGTCCHPIIDLLSDGTFISCYPLNNFLKIKMDDTMVARDLTDKFEASLTPYKQSGIYPYCSSCPLFNNRCNGGCMSFRIQRYMN
jgi:radical SAM protein with 4Fe4S-binding SPASM domain